MTKDFRGFWHGRSGRYVPLLLIGAGILLLSTSEASAVSTSRFIRPLLEFLFPTADETTLALYHGIIRKFAHLGEYALLGIAAGRAFAGSSKLAIKKFWPAVTLASVVGVASFDEINQSFNPLRTGSIVDVGIDVTGGVLGILIFLILGRIVASVFSPRSGIKPPVEQDENRFR